MQKIEIRVNGTHVGTIKVEDDFNETEIEMIVAEHVATNTEWDYA